MTSRILRRPEVQNRTGLPTSTLYALIADGRFPRPVKIGKRAVGWMEGQVEGWIVERVTDAAGRDVPFSHGGTKQPSHLARKNSDATYD
ncbi:putative DNA-binding transcriptional regulator AlpA [Rhizobium sp. BK196]|uniref:helix-turn-helix transcriptional regulator n=1 Tax=Rhizobium sp. BK196 TaxID=2587073 RepID=UPI00161C08C2|nr:AlpA family transcriptional regulator [Rhizobium sp. BK196]MBB3309393.1 putative DNA-binding transcriptional regulator AlpA [Rhizobium sp. BK196]